MKYGTKWPEYAKQWDTMRINSNRVVEFKKIAEYAIANKAIYLSIAAKVGMLWAHIAVIHKRESDSQDKNGNPRFDSYLGNGQPLNRKTTIVPKGRGPFKTFEEGALDALHLDGLDAIKDWRLEKILYYCEVFNGGGYSVRGLPSPYVWGGTSIQRPGKFVSDARWNGSAVDTQPGCAPILYMIAKLDSTVQFIRED